MHNNKNLKNLKICAGYYARVKGMRMLLDQFLAQTRCNCQVINLGAGFDSLFWLLKVTVTTTTPFKAAA